MAKPNVAIVMQQLIRRIQHELPLHLTEAQLCHGSCLGCSKKMIEMLDDQLSYWQANLEYQQPSLADLAELTTLAQRTAKILKRNGWMS